VAYFLVFEWHLNVSVCCNVSSIITKQNYPKHSRYDCIMRYFVCLNVSSIITKQNYPKHSRYDCIMRYFVCLYNEISCVFVIFREISLPRVFEYAHCCYVS